MSTSNVPAATVAARLPSPASTTEEAMFSTTQSQLAAVQACPDYKNQPAVQAIVKTLLADNTSLGAAVAAYEKAKAELPGLRAASLNLLGVVRRDRHSLAGALTTACNGSIAAIQAWGAVPGASHATLPVSTAAPANIKLITSKTPGVVRAQCTKVDGAASYLWSLVGDPTVAPSSVTPVVSTGTRVSIPAQTVGHVMYLRVAVVRHRSGQSVWSDALQFTVR